MSPVERITLHPHPGLSLLPEGVSVGHIQVCDPGIDPEKGQRDPLGTLGYIEYCHKAIGDINVRISM
jgi:hypothetical protein